MLNVDIVGRKDRILKGNLVAMLGSIFAAVFFMRFHAQAKKFWISERIYVLSLTSLPICLLFALASGNTDVNN